MPIEIHRTAFPGIAASAINARQPVTIPTGASERGVCPVASTHQPILGIALATAAQGEAVTVHDEGNTVICTAGASLGVGAQVAIGSTNGALVPLAGASGTVRNVVGIAVGDAAAGAEFSVYVRPRLVSGTP